MPRCSACGTSCSGGDAYTCSFCERVHCGEHRLPEKHDCPFQSAATPPEVPESSDSAWTGARDVISGDGEATDRSSEAPPSDDVGGHPDAVRPTPDSADGPPSDSGARTYTCDYCGGETDEIHRCNYCGGTYCRVHDRRQHHDCFDDPSPDVAPDGSVDRSGAVGSRTGVGSGGPRNAAVPPTERVRVAVTRVTAGLSTVLRVVGLLALLALALYGAYVVLS